MRKTLASLEVLIYVYHDFVFFCGKASSHHWFSFLLAVEASSLHFTFNFERRSNEYTHSRSSNF